MTEQALAEARPEVLVDRWRKVDVCAILDDHHVTWVARDVLVAAEGDAGEYAEDPGHDPLVMAQHRNARAWTLDQARRMVAGSRRGDGLLHWMQQRELTFAQLGFRNIVRLASPAGAPDEPQYIVATAAQLLNRDPRIQTGQTRLFDHLLTRGWILRRGNEYAPTQTAIDAGLVAVVPRRKPHNGDPWPQVVITRTGLHELHALLGGSDPSVLEQEPQP